MNTSATTQSRAFILGLPNEILHNIATLLLTDPSALCKLSSTCRELEDIARPIIFRSFSEADGSFRAADHGLKAFLETIQENVRLGGFVRTLKIKDMQCSKDARYKHHSLHSTFTSLAPKSLDISTIAIKESGIATATLSALLSACKKLKNFSYQVDQCSEFSTTDQPEFDALVNEIRRKNRRSIERIEYFDLNASAGESEECRDYLDIMTEKVSTRFPKLKVIRTWIYNEHLEGFDEVVRAFAAKGIEADPNWGGFGM